MTARKPGHVIALVGHVDHGKSSVAWSLTGQSVDRRPVEQDRGLTVDLGHLHLPVTPNDGTSVALVDVPGHRDYLGNAVVGIAASTGLLLVVAADDGPMPQTVDHLMAARALRRPVLAVALTKVDRVDADRVAHVRRDIAVLLDLYVDIPILEIDAVRGVGTEALIRTLRELPPPTRINKGNGHALDVAFDRGFDLPGVGRVLTGTLHGGTVAVGDHVRMAPSNEVIRVRGLQIHGRPADVAHSPTRVALRLAGAVDEAGRGARLGSSEIGWPRASATVDVALELDGEPPPGVVRLHLCQQTTGASLRPLIDGEPVTTMAVDRPVVARVGDRFVLDDPATGRVLGGGVVLDPTPPPRRRGRAAREARAADLQRVLSALGDPAVADELLDADGGVSGVSSLQARLGLRLPDHVLTAGGLAISTRRRGAVDRALAEAAGADPDLDQVVQAAAAATGVDVGTVRAVMRASTTLHVQDRRVVLTDRHRDLDDARSAGAARLHLLLRAHPLDPPRLAKAAAACGVTPEDLERLVARGAVHRVGDHGFLPEAVELVVARLATIPDGFTVAGARDVLGVSRRHAVPWLELLDRLGITERVGDRRHLRTPPHAPAAH